MTRAVFTRIREVDRDQNRQRSLQRRYTPVNIVDTERNKSCIQRVEPDSIPPQNMTQRPDKHVKKVEATLVRTPDPSEALEYLGHHLGGEVVAAACQGDRRSRAALDRREHV